MSSKKKAVTASPELIEKVRAVVAETRRTHEYSMSRIYAAHNEVTGRSDPPRYCSTCLVRRVNELEAWLRSVKPAKPAEPEPVEEGRA